MGRNRPILAPELMSVEPPPGDDDAVEDTFEDAPSQPENDVQMSFFDHLDELRTRLIRSTYVFLPAVAVAWIYRVPLLDFLAIPLGRAIRKLSLPTNGLHFLSPADAFVVYMKLALFVSFLASSP
jgi:sec-independent protein translocase protein TatC